VNSSSAYKYEQKEYYVPRRQVEEHKVVKIKEFAEQKNKMKTVFSVLVCSAITFFMIFRYTAITEASNTVNSYKKELNNMQRITEQTQVQLDRSVDLKKVEEIAKNRLGMDRPEKSQIVYVKLKKNDYSEVLGEKYASTGKSTLWLGFLNTITAVLEILN
jgi:cell division protein FtsL